jgi:hypothetical protein
MQHAQHSAQADLFDLSQFGRLLVPAGACDITFQLDIIPSESPAQIWFGLATLSPLHQTPDTGFAIRVDLAHGEVWDALNRTGFLGHLETGPLGLDQYDAETPLLLSFHIEKRGENLVPSLRVGSASFLYPALPATPDMMLCGLAGAAQPGADAGPFCLYPALWLAASA